MRLTAVTIHSAQKRHLERVEKKKDFVENSFKMSAEELANKKEEEEENDEEVEDDEDDDDDEQENKGKAAAGEEDEVTDLSNR